MTANVFTLILTARPGTAGKTIAQMTTDKLVRRGCRVETLRDELSGPDLNSSVDNTQDADDGQVKLVYELSVYDETIARASFDSESGEAEELRYAIVEVEIRDSAHSTEASVNQSVIDSESEQLKSRKIFVDADVSASESSVAHILSRLEDWGLISRQTPKDDSYDEEDEKVIRSRLESLGYL
jgi:hypothetical protein